MAPSTTNVYFNITNLTSTINIISSITTNKTSNRTFSYKDITYSEDILKIVSTSIAIIFFLIALLIIIYIIKYFHLKLNDPIKFYGEYIIAPPSLKLLYYLQIIDLFIISCKWYLWLIQGLSWLSWNNYCNQYVDTNFIVSIDECEIDKYCYYVSYNECNPNPGGIEAIMIINIFAGATNFMVCFYHYFITCPEIISWDESMAVHGDSLCILCNNTSTTTWKSKYYEKEFFKFNCYTIMVYVITIIFYFSQTISFAFLFNGPNTNLVEPYMLFAVLSVIILNEFIKFYIYATYRIFIYDIYVLYLLEYKVGKNLAKLIYVDFADRDKPIPEMYYDDHNIYNNIKPIQIEIQRRTKKY